MFCTWSPKEAPDLESRSQKLLSNLNVRGFNDIIILYQPQSTDMNLEQTHCLASRAPTLDLWLEITKIRKFVIQGIIWTTKF